MSNLASPPHPNPFVERLILFLMPYFLLVAPDPAVAREEILETSGSYGGRTRAEVINAARIINRSCHQNEQKLAKRLACALPEAIEHSTEPVNDVSDPEYQEAMQRAHDEIAAHRNRLAAARSPNVPSPRMPAMQQAQDERMLENAMMAILGEPGMQVQPATP